MLRGRCGECMVCSGVLADFYVFDARQMRNETGVRAQMNPYLVKTRVLGSAYEAQTAAPFRKLSNLMSRQASTR